MTLSIRKLHGSLGAEVRGVNLSTLLDSETKSKIEEAWKSHGVLVFRNQNISDAEHVAFSHHFGKLEVLPETDRTDVTVPEIFVLSNVDSNGKILPAESEEVIFNSLTWSWHTDSCYREIPSRGAILHGIEVVKGGGGETRFANLKQALAEMPSSLRQRIESLESQHSWAWMRSHRSLPPMRPEEEAKVPPVQHKLIRNHFSGGQSLYISPIYMRKIVGWSEEKTKSLVEELTEWATQDRFVYEHNWLQNDVVMWDNTWTMHMVLPYDATSQRRIMHRTAIAGVEAVL
jgi:alpha-ketoglutarate-dependent taurine dioxygenase